MLIRIVPPAERETLLPDLVDLLRDNVAGGASVGFMEPPEPGAATRWWARTLADHHVLTWIATDDEQRVAGCVQLRLIDEESGRHRANVEKLLVHRRARGNGLGGRLLAAAEEEAKRIGRWLLMLDTQTGSDAEAFYRKRGWELIGRVAEHAGAPDGRLHSTTFLTKRL